MKLSINRNQVLLAIGLLSTEGPDVAAVAAWLPTLGIPHLTGLIHLLGTISLMLGGLALAWPRIRSVLAAAGLATPPGAVAPWDPTRDAEPAGSPPIAGSVVALPAQPQQTKRPGSDYGSKVGVLLVFLLSSMLFAGSAFAQTPQAIGCIDKANAYCVVPAAAVGWQINLKTGDTANGVALLGLTLQHTFGSLPLGLGLYGGLGASNDNHGSYQGCIGLSITNWGLICGGAAHVSFSDNSTAWQGMLTFAGQLTSGGTPAYVTKTAAQAEYQGFSKGISAGK
jgi:hypothetical protein